MALQFLNNGYFAGKVGIGIENPIRLLSLYSDNTETTPRLLIEQDGTGDAVMAFSLTSGQGWSMGIDNSLGDAFMIHNSASGVDSSSQFTILNSGNVGIGTINPNAKLEVITTRTGTPSSDTNIKVTDDSAQAADVGGSINFTGKYTDTGIYLGGSPFIRASKKNATTGDYGYGLKLGVRATGSGTSNVAMTIDSDSNVGIGTTTPDSKLQIMNNDGSSYRFGYGGSSDVYLDADNVYIRTDNGGANTATFTTTGLGIGTTTPDAALEVNSGGGIHLSDNTAGRTLIIKPSLTGTVHEFTSDNTIAGYSFSNNSSEFMRISANGNVGIGTTSPAAKLHIADTNKAINTEGNLFVATTDAYAIDKGGQISLGGVWHSTPLTTGFAAIAGRKQTAVNGNAGGYLQLSTSNSSGGNLTEKMRITSAGGISFGSTGTAYGTSGQILKSNGNASPTWIDGSTIPGVPAGSGTLNTIPLWTPDGDTLGNSIITQPSTSTIDVDGNILISDTGNDKYFGSNVNLILNADADGNSGSSARNIIFQNRGSEKMRIDYEGNVGIGTTSPDANLEVESASGGVLRLTSSDTTVLTGESIGKIEFKSNDASTSGNNVMGFIDSVATNVGTRYALSFGTGDAAAAVERMRITNLGGISFGSTGTAYGTSGEILKSNGNASPTWVAASTVIGGPYLPLAGGTMTGTNGVLMPDNFKLKFGDATTPDLEIYHDGGNSFINDTGAGALLLKSNGNGVYIKTIAGDTQAQFLNDGAVNLYYDNSFKFATTSTGVSVTGDVQIDSALLSNQENTDVDTGTETVANVAIATYTAAFFDFVIKKTTNVRSGTVYACHDGTNVEFTETSTQDLGDTSDVTLSVDISGGNMRLRATTTSDDWSVKSLIRAI